MILYQHILKIYFLHFFFQEFLLQDIHQDHFVLILKDIVFNGRSVIDNEITIPSYSSGIDPTIIKTPYTGIQDEMFTVNTEYQGYSRNVKNNITLISDEIVNPLLLNTADDLGNSGPDFKYGWGEVNALRAVQIIENQDYQEDSISHLGNNTHNITSNHSGSY